MTEYRELSFEETEELQYDLEMIAKSRGFEIDRVYWLSDGTIVGLNHIRIVDADHVFGRKAGALFRRASTISTIEEEYDVNSTDWGDAYLTPVDLIIKNTGDLLPILEEYHRHVSLPFYEQNRLRLLLRDGEYVMEVDYEIRSDVTRLVWHWCEQVFNAALKTAFSELIKTCTSLVRESLIEEEE